MNKALQRRIAIIIEMDSAQVGRHAKLVEAQFNRLKSVLRTVGSALTSLPAVVGIASLTGAVVLLGKSVLETGMQFEKFSIQLRVLYGSAEKGEAKFAWIKKFARETPYELAEIVDAFVRLKAVGLQGDKDNILKDLGDLASAAQKPLEQVIHAIQNIKSGMTGIGIRELELLTISKEMLREQGVIFSKSGEALSQSNDIVKAVQRVIHAQNFSGMMEQQAKSMSGILSNIKDAWTQVKDAIAQKIFPIIKPDLKRIQDFLGDLLDTGKVNAFADKVAGMFKKAYDWAKEWLPKIFDATASAVNTLVDTFSPIAKFFIENPTLVAGAAIVMILMKAVGIAKDLAVTIQSIGILSLTSKLSQSIGITSAAARFSGAVIGGSAAGAAGAGAAGAAGLSIAAIAPIVIGVLGTAAVGYGIYQLWKKFKDGAATDDAKDKTDRLVKLRMEFDGAAPELAKTGHIRELLNQYTALSQKATLTADEQMKLNSTIKELADLMPDTVLSTGKYGGALQLNIARIEANTRAEEKRLAVMQKQLEFYQKDAIEALGKSADDVDLLGLEKMRSEFPKLEREVVATLQPFENMKNLMDKPALNRLETFVQPPTSIDDAKQRIKGQDNVTDLYIQRADSMNVLLKTQEKYKDAAESIADIETRALTTAQAVVETYQVSSYEDILRLPARWGGEWRKWILTAMRDMEKFKTPDEGVRKLLTGFITLRDEQNKSATQVDEYKQKLADLLAMVPEAKKFTVTGEVTIDELQAARALGLLSEDVDKLLKQMDSVKNHRLDDKGIAEYEAKMQVIAKLMPELAIKNAKGIVVDLDITKVVTKAQQVQAILTKLSEDTGKSNFAPSTKSEEGFAAIEKAREILRKEQNTKELLEAKETARAKLQIQQAALEAQREQFEKFRQKLITPTEMSVLFGPDVTKALDIDQANQSTDEVQKRIKAGELLVKGIYGEIFALADRNVQAKALDEVRAQTEQTNMENRLRAREMFLKGMELQNAREQGRVSEASAKGVSAGFSPQDNSAMQEAVRAQEKADLLKEQQDQQVEYFNRVVEIESQYYSVSAENFQSYLDHKVELELRYEELRRNVKESTYLTEEQKAATLAAVEQEWKTKGLTFEKAAAEKRVKTQQYLYGKLSDAAQRWAKGEMTIQSALAASGIQATADMVTGVLRTKQREWAAKAAAYAAEGNFAAAAGLTAAAAAAGAGITYVQSYADKEIEKLNKKKEDQTQALQDELNAKDLESSARQTQAGYSTRGVQNMYIQPSVTITGQTVIVGDTGLETAAATIGSIAVSAIKDAFETGELQVGAGV